MRLATALLLLQLTSPAVAQPSGSTIGSGGGPGGDIGERVAVAPYTGETAVVGTFEQTATFGPDVSVTSADAPAARSDAFVVFYGADGVARWARRMGTEVFNDFGAGVALSEFVGVGVQRVYVSGYFTGIATFDGGANPDVSLTTRNDFDAFLAAYDADGDLLWVAQAGGGEQDTGRGLAADDSGVYWTGSFTGTATWGAGDDAVTRTSAGGSDGFLARFSPDGDLSWVTTVGGPESDDLRAVAPPDWFSGSVRPAVTGTFRSVATFGTIPLSSRGLSDIAVLSVDPWAGEVTWARQVGGNGNDYARGVAQAFDGRIAVAGSFESTILVGTDVLTSAGFSDALLAVFDADGTEVAGHRGGGAGFDIANDVSATPVLDTVTGRVSPLQPAIAVVGYVEDASTFGTTPLSAQGVDGFAAVYLSRPDGVTLEAAYAIGGANSDRAYGASVGGYDFSLRVTGFFRDAVTFGGESVTSAGSNDVFLASIPLCPTFTCPVLVSGDEGPEDGVRMGVSPNPSPARLSLSLASPADATVELVDALGRTVARLHAGSLPAGESVWAPPRLAPGAYWLVARTGDGVYRQGFTVAR